MRKSVILISLVFILSLGSNLQAQDLDMYHVLDGKLSTTEEKQVRDSEEDVGDGDRMISVAEGEYQKYEKLFSSGKKGKIKKGEKKTVGAKKKLITASNKLQQGYKTLFDLYKTKVQRYSIADASDKQKIDDLIKNAETEFKTGEAKLKKAKPTFSDKDLKKKVKYKQLKSNVVEGGEKQKSAVEKLVDALTIAEGQDEKRQLAINNEKSAWDEAIRLNTIPAYQSYISNYPTGKHLSEAKDKISEKENDAKNIANQNEKAEFYIQFAASKKALSSTQVNKKLNQVDPYCTYGTRNEVVNYEEYKYKYMFGPFNSYEDARTHERTLRLRETKVFIVAYKNDKRVEIDKAVDHTPSDHPGTKPIK